MFTNEELATIRGHTEHLEAFRGINDKITAHLDDGDTFFSKEERLNKLVTAFMELSDVAQWSWLVQVEEAVEDEKYNGV